MHPLPDSPRTLLTVSGDDRVAFLQGLLTNDVTRLAAEKIQFAALLSPQGKILHDMFLVDAGDSILIDVRAEDAALLMKRLNMYKLRAQVKIDDPMIRYPDDPWSFTANDPRHPELPERHYACSSAYGFHLTDHRIIGPSDHRTIGPSDHRLRLGIPECGRDFAPDTVTALDAGYDLLHAISFTKGCYVGQEITARMHYKNIARKGFFILERDGKPARLALLKFEEVYGPASSLLETSSPRVVTVDNETFTAHLPTWMEPKLRQFHASATNQ